MTKATLTALVNYLTEKNDDYMMDVLADLTTELNKGAEVKAAKAALYEAAKPVVMEVLRSATAPITAAELWEACEDEMPEGVTKGMVQYALTRLWGADIRKVSGKVNAYTVA